MFSLCRLARSLALSVVASIVGSVVLSKVICSISAATGIAMPSFLLIVV